MARNKGQFVLFSKMAKITYLFIIVSNMENWYKCGQEPCLRDDQVCSAKGQNQNLQV